MTLLFSIHYFLWYGALNSILGYESVYARHYTNATTLQYGYLNMLLPFMTVIVTPVICSLADRHRSHRTNFTVTLVITTISLCLYAMMPLLLPTGTHQDPSDHQVDKTDQADSTSGGLRIGPWIYYCIIAMIREFSIGINTCLSDSFAALQAEQTGTSFGRVVVWGTFGGAAVALVLSLINQCNFLPRLIPGLLFGALLLAIDVVIVIFYAKPQDFELNNAYHVSRTEPLSVVTSDGSKCLNNKNESAPIDGTRVNTKELPSGGVTLCALYRVPKVT